MKYLSLFLQTCLLGLDPTKEVFFPLFYINSLALVTHITFSSPPFTPPSNVDPFTPEKPKLEASQYEKYNPVIVQAATTRYAVDYEEIAVKIHGNFADF